MRALSGSVLNDATGPLVEQAAEGLQDVQRCRRPRALEFQSSGTVEIKGPSVRNPVLFLLPAVEKIPEC